MDILIKCWFAISLIFMGLFAVSLGIINAKRNSESKDWPAIGGVVTKSGFVTKTTRRRPRSGGYRTKHLPEIQFRYFVDQFEFENRQRYFSGHSPAQ